MLVVIALGLKEHFVSALEEYNQTWFLKAPGPNVSVLQVSYKGGENSCVRRASLGATNFGVHSKSLGY